MEAVKHTSFIEGPISPLFIADSIAKHSRRTNIGAHDIFLGQVRSDVIEGKVVQGIEYMLYEQMAEKRINEIREKAFQKFTLSCLHIYHSTGLVQSGGICLFVFISAGHRDAAFEACRWIVEEIKSSVPVWGREIFVDKTYTWKKNN